MSPFFNILIVGAGSCLGGMARYMLSCGVQSRSAGEFPWGTLAVNLLGCLILGVVYGLLERGFRLSEPMKLFLTVGFCGGFTTFSTFIRENSLLFGAGSVMLFAAYATLSIVAGMMLLYAGYFITRLIH
ncbi:MAG: CrcB family protein [Muribaculaceae bacterium]|nr:CrcB family protein [Muribaculaceae bacterium]